MIIADRVQERMRAAGLSQGELARRLKVSQPTIYRVFHGKAYGSTHIHRIARELGTTPAYLTGETDDPLADAPDAPFIGPDEQELVDCYRVMTPADRKALMHIACSMAGRYAKPETFSVSEDAPATVHAPGHEFHYGGGKT